MKDREVAKIRIDQANKVLDVVEGKAGIDSATIFRGSHIKEDGVDLDSLKKRLQKYKKTEVKDIKKDRIITKSKARVK